MDSVELYAFGSNCFGQIDSSTQGANSEKAHVVKVPRLISPAFRQDEHYVTGTTVESEVTKHRVGEVGVAEFSTDSSSDSCSQTLTCSAKACAISWSGLFYSLGAYTL